MSDNSGILEELQADKEMLAKIKLDGKNIVNEEILLTSSPFFTVEETSGKLVISGIALAEGIWRNVLYPAEEIQKAAKNLIGKPLLIEHGQDKDFEKKQVGKVLDTYYDKNLKSMVFRAEVTDPEAISLIKDGTFPAVSCSTFVDKFPVNSEQSIGFNFNYNELSLVRTGACEKCFIFAVEELSKRLSKKDLNIKENKEEVVKEMTEKTDEEEIEEVVEELVTEEIDLAEVEQPKLFAVIEAETLADFDETLAKKVVSYYYGYGYPYGEGKYPYPQYPYYPYYPYGKKGKYPYKKPEKKSLWTVLQLERPEEIEDLKKQGKKVVGVYYGYYGYPYSKYPYYGKGYYPYGKYPEKKAEEYKCPEGQVYDEKSKKCIEAPKEMAKPEYTCPEGQEWDPDTKKCVEKLSAEEKEIFELLEELALSTDYIAFVKKCMKESKTMPVVKRMKECAVAYKKQKPEEKAKEEYKCPEGEVFDEKEKKCVPTEGKEKYPVPEQKASPAITDFRKEDPLLAEPGPTLDAGLPKVPQAQVKGFDEQAKNIKLSVETDKKEEVSTIPKVESPMVEEPCKDCPKEEEKASEPKTSEPEVEATVLDTPKVEEEVKPVESPEPLEIPKELEKPKEESKVETPKVESPEEKPKVETPKEEIPVQETPKETPEEEVKQEPVKSVEPTAEEIKTFVKTHYPELLLELIKREKAK